MKPLPALLLESPPPYNSLWYNTEAETHNASKMKQSANLKPFKINAEKSP